jgi:hypothetical protein
VRKSERIGKRIEAFWSAAFAPTHMLTLSNCATTWVVTPTQQTAAGAPHHEDINGDLFG